MKIIFLLPPSEGKNIENKYDKEKLSFNFLKPFEIAKNATEKDLKCKGIRYLEAINLNANIQTEKTLEAIKRYSGVMYNAIDYVGMDKIGKDFFLNNFLIFSGFYGLVKPLDFIANYKLPVSAKGIYDFWGDSITKSIADLKADYIVNLLPISYCRLLGLDRIFSKNNKKLDMILSSGAKIININFLKEDGKKISHGVKKIKGEWIKNICEKGIVDYKLFGGDVLDKGRIIDIDIIKK